MSVGTRWTRVRLRLRYWARRRERQRLLWEEMEFHIESMVEELVGAGLSEQDARAAAHRKFGDMTRTSEDAHAAWIAQWMTDAWHDLKHACRGMRRDAGFTTCVILIAGLGIGASSTTFSVVNARSAWLRMSGCTMSTALRHSRQAPARRIPKSRSLVRSRGLWPVRVKAATC
jgi:hypothetical protein